MAFDKNKIGEVRPNQLITTFGPGAIIDAVKDSVTVLDTNYWTEKGKKIIDGRLATSTSGPQPRWPLRRCRRSNRWRGS